MQIPAKITVPDKDKCVFPNGDYCVGVQDLCSRCGIFDMIIEFGVDSYDPVKCKPCLELSNHEKQKTKEQKEKEKAQKAQEEPKEQTPIAKKRGRPRKGN